MPKIGNIGLDAVLSDGDKLLGTDSGGQTKNFSLRQLRNFMAENSGVFKHVQTNASQNWGTSDGSGGFYIIHNLDLEDHLPSVTLKINGGTYNNVQAMGIVTYVDKNKLRINLSEAHAGFAYIKK